MKHRLIVDAASQPIGAAYLDDQGAKDQALAWAVDQRGALWPWIITAEVPFSGDVDCWPRHEHETRLDTTTRKRIRSEGRQCAATAPTTGHRCRRMVLDGTYCAQHQVDNADYFAALAAFTAGYGYRHDADGHHLVYLDSGRLLTFDTADQVTAHLT